MTGAFVRQLAAATTRRVSVTPSGDQAPGGGFATSISADGSVVAFLAAGLTPTAGALLQAYVRLLPAPGR